MNPSTLLELGPGTSGYDSLRSIPEPTAISLGILAIALAIGFKLKHMRNRREVRRGLRSPSTSYPV